MKKKLPVYKLKVNPDDKETGVSIISLVNDPAIEVNWVTFSKQQPILFKVQNLERQIILSAALIPDKPIYRNDENGEYEVVIDAPTIRDVVEKFMANKNVNNVDIEHGGELISGITMLDCFISDEQMGVSNPKGFEGLPVGTWFVSYKVNDPELWEKIKQGDVKGFSITGLFDFLEVDLTKATKEKTPQQVEKESIQDILHELNQLDKLLPEN